MDLEVEDEAFFRAVRDHAHPFFLNPGSLWVLSLPVGAVFDENDTFTEWAGARVWWRTDAGADTVRARARTADGYAASFPPRLTDVAPPVAKYMRRVKVAFDPANILNAHLLPHAD